MLLDHVGAPICLTLEPTDEELKTVIPAGEFKCLRTFFYGGNYPTHEIQVPGHSRVLYHIGNTEPDTIGCVLLGLELGVLKGKAAVLQSKRAYDRYWALTKEWQSYDLEVIGMG